MVKKKVIKRVVEYEPWDDPWDGPITECPFRMRDEAGCRIYVGTELCRHCKYWERTCIYPRFVVCTCRHIPLREIPSLLWECMKNLFKN